MVTNSSNLSAEVARSPAPTSVKKSFWTRHKINSGLLFVLPALLVYLLFVAWPIISTVSTSFYNWDGVSPQKNYVGFKNYVDLLTHDRNFQMAIRNNVLWAILTIGALTIFGFLIAYMLNQKLLFKNIYRTLIFLPTTASLVVIGYTWQFMYRADGGIVNQFLTLAGREDWIRVWLADTHVTIYAVIIVGIWSALGVWVVIYLAALQGIPQDLYDSAAVDGATGFRQMIHIAIPMTSSTTRALLILGFIGAINQFGLVYLLSKGGPYHASEVMAYQIYDLAFKTGKVGYSSALSVVLLFISAVVTVIQLLMLRGKARLFG
jgi:ABC-type sugar transport system permease subunit